MFKKIQSIPKYGWILGIVFFVLESVLYEGSNLICKLTGAVEGAVSPKIPSIDNLFPLISVFVVIYCLSFPFWVIGTAAVSLTKRENFINYLCGLLLAYIMGFLVFLFFPTYMDREAEGLLLAVKQQGFFGWWLNIIYSSDGGARAYNLFPSYHCLISLFCYLGIRRQPEISRGFKWYTAIMTLLICISTLLTKQHYFMDVISGLSFALIAYLIVAIINPGKRYLTKKEKAATKDKAVLESK